MLTRRLVLASIPLSRSAPVPMLLSPPLPAAPRRSQATKAAMMTPEAAVAAAAAAMDTAYGPWQQSNWAPAAFDPNHSHKGRYLWTDAFGVCNYCSLYLETGDERYLRQAEALVAAVHGTLGFTRDGSHRLGDATADHPTRGGLRIGKADADGPDGDGQYLHYLTKWAYALLQLSAAADEPRYLLWALELAEGTFHRFLCLPVGGPGGTARPAWKMDVTLSRPLARSSGNLDAFDALVTWRLLSAAADRSLGDDGGRDRLAREVAAAAALVKPWWSNFDSDDPLDLGEALWLSHWLCSGAVPRATAAVVSRAEEQEAAGGGVEEAPLGSGFGRSSSGGVRGEEGLDLARASDHIAARALMGLEDLWEGRYFERPVRARLGFRELGATLGVQALISRVPELPQARAWASRVAALHEAWGGAALTARDTDITPVMFAASVLPRVWLKG